MGADLGRGGEHDAGGFRPILLLGFLLVGDHFPHVVGVRNGEIAFTGKHRLGLFAVVATWLGRQICFQARQPFLGRGFALVGNDRRDHAQIVRVIARPKADFAFPLRISKFFIADGVLAHPVLGRVHHPGPHGEAKPQISGVAQGRRNLVQNRRQVNRLCQSFFGGNNQSADIGAHEQISRA